MRALWLVAALWLVPLLVAAQTLTVMDASAADTTDETATPDATAASNKVSDSTTPTDASSATPAFSLVISAPDDIKALVERAEVLRVLRKIQGTVSDATDRVNGLDDVVDTEPLCWNLKTKPTVEPPL